MREKPSMMASRGRSQNKAARNRADPPARMPHFLSALPDIAMGQGRRCRREIMSAIKPSDQMMSADRKAKIVVSDRLSIQMS